MFKTSFSCFQSLRFLLQISRVDDVEVFKICLDYWNVLVAELYRENPFGGTM